MTFSAISKFNLHKGSTLLFPIPNAAYPHLFIIITEPEKETGNVIIVNIETQNSITEKTVILQKGDHPFIIKPTSVRYVDARIISIFDLDKKLEGSRGEIKIKEDLDTKILEKICEGMNRSKTLSREVKEFYQNITWQL